MSGQVGHAGIEIDTPRSTASTILGGAVGNLIEWYDWTIYGLLSSVFAAQIVPTNNPSTSLIAVLLTFAIGFLMRPVGSLVLSPMADRYGRRRVLALTIILMGNRQPHHRDRQHHRARRNRRQAARLMLRIGIDIGGTFTDFAIWRGGGYGEVEAMKVPSTPPRFAEAVITGLKASSPTAACRSTATPSSSTAPP